MLCSFLAALSLSLTRSQAQINPETCTHNFGCGLTSRHNATAKRILVENGILTVINHHSRQDILSTAAGQFYFNNACYGCNLDFTYSPSRPSHLQTDGSYTS